MLNLIGVLFDGLAYGMLLFLLSVGLSVTMGLMGFVNLAHAAFAMAGGYALVALMSYVGLPYGPAVVLAALSAALLGLVLEPLAYRPLYRAKPLSQVLLTVGLIFISVSAATFLFGPGQQAVSVPESLRGQITVGGIDLSRYRLFLIVLGAIIAAAVLLGLERTRLGARIRAAVDDQAVAASMGIPVQSIFRLVFALGCALAGLGGALGIEVFGLDPTFPVKYLVYCLLVVVVGGTGSVLGSLYAALGLGIADVAGKYYLPQAGAFVVYALMILLLVLFPRGLKGQLA